ncbi:MAG TPA: BMP family ABC transporter substrate-binding protein, partial [Ilumatobacteraceae bacterium]
ADGSNSDFGYTDPERAHRIAADMFNDGVDVIFVAAGESGRGVIEAAAELSSPGRQLWVIGVDSDQYYDVTDAQRTHLLTSMFKSWDRGIEVVVAARDAGTLVVPGNVTVTMADGGVGYTDSGGQLQPPTIDALESFRSKIVDGTITVDPLPATEPPTAPPPFLLDVGTGATTPLARNLAGGSDYAVSPDGRRLARGTCCSENDVLTISNLDGTDEHVLQAPDGLNYYGAQWSPDGTQLVYQARNGAGDDVGNLFVQDLSTGRVAQITDLELNTATWWWLAPSFSPDGRNVIFQLPRDSSDNTKWDVWSVPVTGGEPTIVQQDAAVPMYFPDGRTIAFTEISSGGELSRAIFIADARGSRRTLVTANQSIWVPTMSPDGSRIAYGDGGSIYVVDVSTGVLAEVATGDFPEWVDDDTLIVVPEE